MPSTRYIQCREEYPAEFVLDYLPPYNPELNPIEQVWELTRRLDVLVNNAEVFRFGREKSFGRQAAYLWPGECDVLTSQ